MYFIGKEYKRVSLIMESKKELKRKNKILGGTVALRFQPFLPNISVSFFFLNASFSL